MKSFICVESIFLPILENGKETNKGERLFEGTSVIILDSNLIRKKNGTRVYRISDDKFRKCFTEEVRYKYYGLDSEVLGLKKGKEYLYGGHFIDSNGFQTHKIFTKRFPKSEFLEITNEEFNTYFNKEHKFDEPYFKATINMINILLRKREEFDLKLSRYKDFSPEYYKIKERKSLFITFSKK